MSKVPIRVLASGTFAVGTDTFVVAGFLPDMAVALHTSEAAAGQSVTVFAAAYALSSPVLATLTARLPRRRLLVGALVVLGVANLGSALAPSLPLLIAGRVLAAAGAAAYTPNAGAVASSLADPRARARALSVVVGGLTAATALGVPLGNLAAQHLGWRTALGLVAVLSLAVAAGVRAVLPELPGHPRVPLRVRLAVLRHPAVSRVLPLTVLGMGAAYTAYAYSVPVLQGAGVRAIGPMLFLYGAGAVAGNLLSGHATDRWSARHVLVAGYAVMAAAMGALAWLSASGTVAPVLVGVLAAAWGASSWCQTPPQQHRLITAAPGEAALLVSLNSSAIYGGIGLGTALGGLTLASGVAWTYGAATLLAAAALAVAVVTSAGPAARTGQTGDDDTASPLGGRRRLAARDQAER
ncbi:MFS transporter [Nonomuraea pusilla]|uniref:Predicted arabinose efflux permease, MFS family n=1 Tax=Nonomuraea pusilla TaxID=46177 RepID=A0A1H7YE99_9ACTN|nr:MFS transporter [Nonomuraea pusilla]SEM44273.1 Predicted arabinose efflux permease, MFS family [Nonomuraea pusilla]